MHRPLSKQLWITIIGLLLSLGIPQLPLGGWGGHLLGRSHLLGQEILWWAAIVVMFGWVLLVEKRRLASVGLKKPRIWDIVLAVILGILLVAGIVLIYTVIFPVLHLRMNASAMTALLKTPFWYRLILVTRAAVSEELLFRGYPIERLLELTRNRLVAGIVPWAAFTVAHPSFWGWAQLIVAGYGGLVLTVLYLWRRNLWANMLAHWIADGSGFLMPR